MLVGLKSLLPILPLKLLLLRLSGILKLDGMNGRNSSLIVLPPIKDRGHLFKGKPLGLHEEDVDEDQDQQGEYDSDDVVFPTNVLQTNGVNVVDGKGRHGETEEHPGEEDAALLGGSEFERIGDDEREPAYLIFPLDVQML